MSRREQYRERTASEIKDIALQLLERRGPSGLSLRAIAREYGLTAPAIYTYYDSMDDLLTALIVQSFNNYAAALEAARDAASAADATLYEQLIEVSRAYRTWAVEHPEQFKLIYGSPIPGYEAPAEVTLPAVLRIGAVFMALLQAIWQQGDGQPAALDEIPPAVAAHLRAAAGEDAPDDVVGGLYDLYGCWMPLHGMVTLEVFGHLQGTVGDCEAFYRDQVERLYAQMGLAV